MRIDVRRIDGAGITQYHVVGAVFREALPPRIRAQGGMVALADRPDVPEKRQRERDLESWGFYAAVRAKRGRS